MCNLSDGVYEDGVNKQKRRTATSLIRSGFPDEVVVKHSELPLEEVRKLRQELALA